MTLCPVSYIWVPVIQVWFQRNLGLHFPHKIVVQFFVLIINPLLIIIRYKLNCIVNPGYSVHNVVLYISIQRYKCIKETCQC